MSGIKKFTAEEYEALKTAIAKGVTKVKYTDKEITYRSMKDMKELLALMECELGCAKKNVRFVASFSKGLGRC